MNRIKIIILGVFLILFFLEGKSQNKLITIYDKNCAYCDDVAHSAKADQSYYARRWRAPVPLEMCYIVPLNQIANNE